MFSRFFEEEKHKKKQVVFSCPPSQSIGRGRISREGALDHRESREQRDKIFAEKTENAKNFKTKIGSGKQFSVGRNFHFLAAGKRTFFLGGGYNFKTG